MFGPENFTPEERAALAAQEYLNQAAEKKRQDRVKIEADHQAIYQSQAAAEAERLAQRGNLLQVKDEAIRGLSTSHYDQLLAFLKNDHILNHLLETIWAAREPAKTEAQIVGVERKAKNWFESGLKVLSKSHFIDYHEVPAQEIPLEPLQEPEFVEPISPTEFFERLNAEQVGSLIELINQFNASTYKRPHVTLESVLGWIYEVQYRKLAEPISLTAYPPFRPPIDTTMNGLVYAMGNHVSSLLAKPSKTPSVVFKTTGEGTPAIEFKYNLAYDVSSKSTQSSFETPQNNGWQVEMEFTFGKAMRPIKMTVPMARAKENMYKLLGDFIVNRLNVRKIKMKLGEGEDKKVDDQVDPFWPSDQEAK
jgi:hypothetical protein